jgi:hypothetical protein
MDNINRYDTPPQNKYRIEETSPENAKLMGSMGQKGEMGRIRANYYNKLRTNSQLNIGGRRTIKSVFKNKKKRTTLLRRRKYSKKNRKSMKRK